MGDVVSFADWLESRERQNVETYFGNSPQSLLASVLETALKGTGANYAVCRGNGVREDRPDDHFGLCPTCHRTDGYLNVGRDHWFICVEHQVTWRAGANIFSDWRGETQAQQLRNARKLERYRVVKPFYWPESGEAQP